MGILINNKTQVLVQGITGHEGRLHSGMMLEYGTKIAAGVTPMRGGDKVFGVPVFDTVKEALHEHAIDASIIFVPAPHAGDAVMEASEAGIKLIVCITEGIPVHDMMKIRILLRQKGVTLMGPNTLGITVPRECKIGIMPEYIFSRGNVGVVSRSGTLTYEAVWQLTNEGIGQSACIGSAATP